MRRYLLLFLLLLATFTGFSQTRVKGKLIDTLTDSKVPRALITIIDYKDSTLIQFTRTNAEGVFELNNMSSGKYIIMVSHPMFAGYSDELTINGQPEIDLGNIQLLSEENLLKELTVLSSDAIKIKGDTIEYTADSFKVKEGATVEDLFKKLPGIQVNKNGEIIAQGKRVEKVLVDGDEFFSDDPTVATQNLKAESVDKVQVFEKKDENSGATDQGAQTINITLKEDAKKGYFGKIKGGIGTDYDPSLANTSGYSPNTFYSNELMINKFKPRNKISAYFVHNNTGKTGLNWDESRKYGENSNINFMDEDGGFYFMTYQAEDEYENYGNKFGGQGIPLAINGGATMDRKWKKDIHHINASYQFKQIENDATSTVNSENYLSDTIFTKEENTRTLTRNQRHNFNMLYEVKTDSLATLKWTVKGNLTNNQKDNFYNAVTLNEEKDTVNTNNRVVNSSLEVMNVNTKLNWFKKFKKPERKLNLNVEYTNKNTAINSSLNSINSIYMADNMMLFNDTIDQRKTTQRVEQTLWVGISHKEPINKNAQLEFKYNFNMNNQVADRFTFDNNGDGTYTNRIDSLSSQYVYDFQSHKAGLNFHYKKNKISFKIGSDVAKQYYDQVDKLNDTTVKRDFLNFFPTSTFVYQFSKMRQFRINYNGYTTQPGIAQIQPLIDNTDPFNITIGNPNLAPSFSNDLTMMFNDNQVLKGRYFYSWANFGYKINDIVTSSSVDQFNRNVMQYVNLKNSGNLNANLNLNYYMDLKKIDMNAHVGANSGYQQNSNYVNGVKNVTTNNWYSINTGLDKDIKEWFNGDLSYEFSYNISGSSIQENANINYWTQNITSELEFIVKKNLTMVTEVSYDMRQKTAIFNQNNNVFIWSASVDVKMFKNRSGVLSLYVNDILNRNLGFQRNASAYSIVQTRYNVIKRYFLVSFTWNFTNEKNKKPQEEDEW